MFDENKRRSRKEQLQYDNCVNKCKKYYIWHTYDVISTTWMAVYIILWYIIHVSAGYLYDHNILRCILRDQSNESIVKYLVDVNKRNK